MAVTGAIRELIQARESAHKIDEQAARDGMASLLQTAQTLVDRGLTDAAEIRRLVPRDCLQIKFQV